MDYSAIQRTLESFYEAAPVLMGTVELLPDGDLLHLYDNPATNRFFGNEPGSTAGRTARMLGVPEPAIAFWRDRYEEAVTSGKPVSFEYVHIAGIGSIPRTLAVTVTSLAVAGPRSSPTCGYIAQDISERSAANEALRDLTATLDLATVFVRDLDGTIRYWPAGCERLYGWSTAEAVGRNAHALLRTVFPIPLEDLTQELERAGEWSGDLRHTTRVGRTLIVVARKVLRRDSTGQPVAVAESVTDVTAARAAEARLRESEATLSAVLDALPVGVIIADAQGRIVRDNLANRALWGVPPETSNWEQYGEWEGYWPDSGRRIAPQEWAMSRALLNGETVRAELVECQPFGGGPRRFYLNNAAPVRDANGHIVAGVVAELDVTEQREVQAALARSNEEARIASERVELASAAGTIVGTWERDLQTGMSNVDEHLVETFGIDPALGRTGLRLEQVFGNVHPEDLSTVRATFHEAIQQGGSYTHEYRVRGRDGVYRWVESIGRIIHGPDGKPMRASGVLLDLERRRAIEAERDRATHLLRAFVDAVPGVVYAKDRDGRMLVANHGMTELVGKRPEDYLGKTDLEFMDDKDQAETVIATDRRIMESGRTEVVEEELNFADGRQGVWLSTKAPFHDDDGRVIGLVSSSIEITARKQAEVTLRERTEELASAKVRLEMAMAAARMGVWEWRPSTGETYWSTQLFEILGLPPSADGRADSEAFMAMVHPDDRAAVDAAVLRSLSHGGDYEAEMRIVGSTGQVIWLMERGRAVHDAQGRPERLVGVNVDITARKVAEQALIDADRRRNEFLAMLGHELRNPLAPITTAVDLLELAGNAPDRRSAALQIIRRQAAHMARLVDDLLEVARVTQGRIELRKENILVASAVYSAIETVRPLVRERQQTLRVDVAPDVDLVADQARLIQIVANLLNNAAKYTQPGGHIEVRAHAVGAENQQVEIVVADNGPGIDEELLPRIFDLFAQGPATLDRARGGLGLGLSLVRRLVELHQGRIWAKTGGPGKGSTFTVCLPRTDRRQAPRGMSVGLFKEAVAPTCFLVVDDNADALMTLAMLLEADGHRVERAADGEEALEVARRFAPQVVLLDIGLPKLDGWEVARRLRTEPATANAVLVALSGYGRSNDRERSIKAGFDHHLLKPVNLNDIYKVIAPLMNRTAHVSARH